MDDHEQTLLDDLRAHGYKVTQARRAVIRALTGSVRPLSVNELHAQAQRMNPAIGLVTIYRTVELLTHLDLIRPVHLMDNCHGYAVASPGHTHHLVCKKCHRAVEFDGCDLGLFLEQVARETGYRITGHWLELEGICARCQAVEAPAAQP